MAVTLSDKEKIFYKRQGRRGFSKEQCKYILQSKRGDVIILKKRRFKKNSLNDISGMKKC